ncbi:MAG TPA: hypothetical protein VFL17_07840 [Anaerolineae bacterium]|nr:hypothetical protein [Anaerolineae bacterium]
MADLQEIADLVAKHLPPSAERVRLRPLDERAREWAEAVAAATFAQVSDEGECDAALGAHLARLPGAALRPGGRAIFLLFGEARPPDELATALAEAGFVRILIEPVLDGAFILARGEPRSDVPDRNALVAALGAELSVAPAGGPLPRYLHLLVRQTPPTRGWDPADSAPVTWEAMTVRDTASGESVLIGFSSLAKAVAFMKPAALAGALPDVNKLPRFGGETVAGWGMPVLLNPAFETLREELRFQFESPPLRVDPRMEDRIRE